MANTVTISGKPFELESLNETAQKMVGNIQAADQRLEQLRVDMALIQIARDVSAKALVDNLPPGSLSGAAALAPSTPVH